MQSKIKWWMLILSMLLLLFAAFLFGWKFSKQHTNASYIQNYSMVRNIAELGVLEVSGISKVDLGNDPADDDNSVLNFLKATLFERRIKLEVPFIAKYGVSMPQSKPIIKNTKDIIEVTFPAVTLLSYELRLDKMDAISRKGLFVFENDEDYLEAERLLYKQNRKQLENNINYIKQSEQRIKDLLNEYFSPSGKKVIVNFSLSSAPAAP